MFILVSYYYWRPFEAVCIGSVTKNNSREQIFCAQIRRRIYYFLPVQFCSFLCKKPVKEGDGSGSWFDYFANGLYWMSDFYMTPSKVKNIGPKGKLTAKWQNVLALHQEQ